MGKKWVYIICILAAFIVVMMIVIYRNYILPDSLNDKIDNLMDSNFTDNFKTTAQSRFYNCQINGNFINAANGYLSKINANASRYQNIVGNFNNGMPFIFPALIHMRESDLDFSTHLYNGDPLTARTVNAPSGRPKAAPANGVSYTFEESAIDSLKYQGFDTWPDWSIPGILYLLEKYNGWGYLRKGVVSPYVWSGSNIYTGGKYTSDGVYNASAVDKQLGAGVLYKYYLDNN